MSDKACAVLKMDQICLMTGYKCCCMYADSCLVEQDCHAMGAQAQTALAVAVVPFGLDSKMEEELFQMLAGAFPVLQEAGCALVGGHTCEGQEASLGRSKLTNFAFK